MLACLAKPRWNGWGKPLTKPMLWPDFFVGY